MAIKSIHRTTELYYEIFVLIVYDIQLTNHIASSFFILKKICSQWSLKIVHTNGTAIGTTPLGESCNPSSDSQLEKCARPTIKECVDRNIYCTDPPVVSLSK